MVQGFKYLSGVISENKDRRNIVTRRKVEMEWNGMKKNVIQGPTEI